MRKALTPAPKKESDDSRLRALMGVRGITEQIAIDLLTQYGSLQNLLKSKVKQKDLMKIKGLGRTTARRIKQLAKRWD